MTKKKPKFRTSSFTKSTDSQWQRISEYLENGRKRKYDLRQIFNAIRWLTRTGSQWRNMSKTDRPPYQIVYYYFRKWQKSRQFDAVLAILVEIERENQGRERKQSAVAVDS